MRVVTAIALLSFLCVLSLCSISAEDTCKSQHSLCGIAVYFNPASYQQKKNNWKRFRRSSKEQGLFLIAVELLFGNNTEELTEGTDCDALIQIRSNSGDSKLWQKERLLNVGLSAVTETICSNIAWLDGEVLLTNHNWVKETVSSLQIYPVVQVFSYAIKLPKNVMWLNPYSTRISNAKVEGVRTTGIAHIVAVKGIRVMVKGDHLGHTGYGWAGRTSLFKNLTFYDYAVVGGADTLMAHAFYENYYKSKPGRNVPAYYLTRFKGTAGPQVAHFHIWAKRAFELIGGKVGFISGTLSHIWHGSNSDRIYESRHRFLRDLDPAIVLSKETCNIIYLSSTLLDITESCFIWAWKSQVTPSSVQLQVNSMFHTRKEDG